jgi:hypothetical protein
VTSARCRLAHQPRCALRNLVGRAPVDLHRKVRTVLLGRPQRNDDDRPVADAA